MPLIRRLPKRGFNNTAFHKFFIPVNVGDLNFFDDGAVVDETALRAAGLASGRGYGIKILASGDLTKKLTVQAKGFSAAAKAAIEAAGGTAELVR
jgi:large subunit ribosomal protein L15